MVTTRRGFLKTIGLSLAAAGCARQEWTQAATGRAKHSFDPTHDKPNIVFIMADDLGYGDLQCFNPKSRILTPHANKLAASGMTFTDAHSPSAVCTPTRYGVVTGRYAWRTRLKRGVLWGYSEPLIARNRMTVASLLKAHGYATGVVGKWHLGLDWKHKAENPKQVDYSKPLDWGPNGYGFDYSYVIPASLDMPPYVYVENGRAAEPPTARQEGRKFPAYIRAGERAPGFNPIETLDVLLGKATAFITREAKGAKPFFLYFALTTPHKPVMPAKRFQGKSGLGPYGDFIMQVDWTVGQVARTLKEAGVRDNTLLVVTSDNGSFMFRLKETDTDHVTDPGVQGYKASSHTSAYVFRGTKADIYEGGHHAPYIASWPARIKAGTTCDKTICLTDLMATCAQIVGAELPRDAGEDSFSTLPLMLGKEPPAPRAPVVHHSSNGTFAVRDGKWKLILSTGSGGREKPTGKPGSKPYRLFDMAADISETTDLAAKHPEIVQRLTRVLEGFQKSGRSR